MGVTTLLRGLLGLAASCCLAQEYQLHYTTVMFDPTLSVLKVIAKQSDGYPLTVFSMSGAGLAIGTGNNDWAKTIQEGALFKNVSISSRTSSWTIKNVSSFNTQGDAKSVWAESSAVTLQGTIPYNANYDVHFDFTITSDPAKLNLDFSANVHYNDLIPALDFVSLAVDSNPTDEIYGMGHQYSRWNLKGLAPFPIVSSEQGIGRGLEPVTGIINTFGGQQGGYWYTTYTACSSYLTNATTGLIVESTNIGIADFSQPQTIQFTYFGATTLKGTILVVKGKSVDSENRLLDLMSALSNVTGRMRPLPDWALSGAILGTEGGSTIVQTYVDRLRYDYKVPLAGVWLQDWSGLMTYLAAQRVEWNWQLNTDWYFNWTESVADWRSDGIRVLGYINPYFTNVSVGNAKYRTNYYQQGADGGFFVMNAKDEIYSLKSGSIPFAMVDLTNPAAREWVKGIIRDNMLGEASLSGWMHDFAEYLPLDAKLHDGSDPLMFHNKYPAEWSRIAQEAVAESQGAEDDIAWFARSGTSASPGIARLFWLGDQMHTYDNFDGLQSALTAHLQGGLSGYSLSHSDVGGFTTVDTVLAHYPRTAELLQRWVEMNTFADAILRTHPGSSPGICAQVYDTPELGAHFCKFATMFRNLAPYKKSLMAEAYTVGTPMTRPLMLHYPNDARARAISDEFMLGSELLMAPIFEVGGTSRNVYLPSGNWVNIFSKVQYACENACDVADVEAPIGSPLVFVRKGGTYFESLLGIASNINC